MPSAIFGLAMATLAGGVAYGATQYKKARDAKKRDEKTPLTKKLDEQPNAAPIAAS